MDTTLIMERAVVAYNRDKQRADQFVVIPAVMFDEIMEVLNKMEDPDNDGLAFDLMTAANIAELKE
jgi:septum formation topological specificity factor MinE